MYTYKNDDMHIPIKSWVPEEEYLADEKMVQQCENLAKLPFAFHHVALSPDGHMGYGMPIGGVLATKNVVIPNAVGVDIGCGVIATRLSSVGTINNSDVLQEIVERIEETIPVGFNKHEEPQYEGLLPTCDRDRTPICFKHFGNATYQIGTLGGGNHFIEIQKSNVDDSIWVMIHSGSRNLGKQVADHYNALAIDMNKKWCSSVPEEWDLAFLLADSDVGAQYLREMDYCVNYAHANRKLMMKRVLSEIYDALGIYSDDGLLESAVSSSFCIAHNYAALEQHYGEYVIVHRKGATKADRGKIGIIPGSQGTKSYIVEGLGNEESFMSCSHGAGRVMGRNAARKTLKLEEEIQKMNDAGVLHNISSVNDLDEAPGAYKNIDSVMENQKDLVKTVVELTPIAVVKG